MEAAAPALHRPGLRGGDHGRKNATQPSAPGRMFPVAAIRALEIRDENDNVYALPLSSRLSSSSSLSLLLFLYLDFPRADEKMCRLTD